VARKAEICTMAEKGSPNDLQEHVVHADTEPKEESKNPIQDDFQTTEAGDALKADDTAAKREAAGEDSQDAMETQKLVEEKEPKPSKLKVLWGKLGLDPVTLILMFK
jgi:hypothetical protein